MSVILRLRKMSRKGYTAYFDLYRKGQRRYEYPDIYLKEDYLRPLKDKDGQLLKDARGNLRYPKPTEQDKLKLELLEKIRLQRELQLKNEEYGFVDSRIKKINLLDYIKELYREKKASIYKSLINPLKKCFGIQIPFGETDEKTVKRFLHYLKEAHLSSNSQCTYFAGLSAVFNQAVRDKIIKQNPCKLIARQDRPKTEESKRSYLTLEELTLLANTPMPGKRSYQIKEGFLFCCLTGLRISDVLRIRYNDIRDGVLQYRQQKSQHQFHYLPLSEQTQRILKELRPDPKDELVFWKLSRKVSASQSLHLLEQWVKTAGITKKVTWHVGRHTCATLLISQGEDIYTVSKLLGHSHVGITERYAKIINTKKVEAVNRIPEIFNNKS
jgi:integrase